MYRKRGALKKLTKRQLEDYLVGINATLKTTARALRKGTFAKTGINQRLVMLMEAAQAKAISYLASEGGLESGRLARSIQISYYENPRTGTIEGARLHIVGPAKKYAKFVEYGTGIVGQETADESDMFVPRGWIYDANELSDSGWPFKSKTRKKNVAQGQFTNFYWTFGQPGKAFMYRAYLMLKGFIREPISEDPKGNTMKWYSVRFGTEDGFSPYIEIKKKATSRKK
jgi:hypothetical protein